MNNTLLIGETFIMNANKTENILEVDLYPPIHDFLVNQGYKVRSEVKHCDVSAIKDNELIIVELKKNLSVNLLVQAVNRQKFADLVYIAVPKPKKMNLTSKWKDIYHLIRRLELGLMFVSFKGKYTFVEVAINPSPFDVAKSKELNKRKRAKLIEEMNGRNFDLNIGGSRGRKLVTSYRENSIFIACCLERFGALSPKKLREIGTDSKKTLSILSENHYGWFYRVDRGLYSLTEQGKEALKTYIELVDYYSDKVNEFCKNEK